MQPHPPPGSRHASTHLVGGAGAGRVAVVGGVGAGLRRGRRHLTPLAAVAPLQQDKGQLKTADQPPLQAQRQYDQLGHK